MTTILTCAMAARDVYENRPGTVAGFHPFHWSDSGSRGFFGASYSAGKVGLIAFRGSHEVMEDWLDADVDMARVVSQSPSWVMLSNIMRSNAMP